MWLAVLAGLLVLAAACGDGSGSSSDGSVRVATMAASTEAAGTARFEGTSEMAGDPPFSATLHGELDFTHDASHLEGTQTNHRGTSETFELRSVDGVVYMTSSQPVPTAIGGSPTKPWIRFPAESSGASLGLPIGNVTDFSQTFDKLAAAGTQVDEVGGEDVRGVSTTHYRFTADLRPVRQVAALDEDETGGARYDVWVDEQHRVRRLAWSTGKGDSATQVSLDFFDFGAPVSIEAPPPDEVATVPGDQSSPGAPWTVVQAGKDDDISWQVFWQAAPGGGCLGYSASEPGARAPDTPTSTGCWASAFGSGSSTASGVSSSSSSSSSSSGSSSSSSSDSSISISASSQTSDGQVTTPTESYVSVDAHAVELANHNVLLYGYAGDTATRALLSLDGGATRALTLHQGVFATVIGPNDLVTRIDLELPGRTVACKLARDIDEYDCTGP